ncbi:FtsB family cell division protein [Alteripontixanthobacter maritimus]|uniref:FtsB family cell division protein n=1 Tax=Alteripontixanthobacter maritimus TaxID=2161824 RepID=UPI002DD8C95E|nr:septum formation initiator [Alteripontixanthobacter maritimus]
MRNLEVIMEQMRQGLALGALLLLGGLAVAGPSGVLAWNESASLLNDRRDQVAVLQKETQDLRNRVALLDPDNADPDMVGELLRQNLNVAHPDELVITLDPPAE